MQKRGSCDGLHRKHGQEELPHTQGQGWQPRAPGCNSTGATERSCLMPEVRGGGQDELPKAEAGAVAERCNPPPRSSSCAGAGGPRGPTLCSRSGGVCVHGGVALPYWIGFITTWWLFFISEALPYSLISFYISILLILCI